tara:strand:+ start:34 stop:177 length:144 start_codon:yes stop_codon:yes gene_type:complete
MDYMENIEEIEEIIQWNLSYGISIVKTLNDLGRIDLIDYFTNENKLF